MSDIYNVIDIGTVARKAQLEDTTDLTYRPDGKRVKKVIFDILSDISEDSYLILDFKNIETCDVSCADEIVFEIINKIISEKLHIFIIITNFNEQVLENFEGAQLYKQQKLSNKLNKKINLPLLLYRDGEVSLLGNIEANLLETLNILKGKEELTARELAELKDLAINNASNRLKRLYDYSLIKREVCNNESGQYYIYKELNYSPE